MAAITIPGGMHYPGTRLFWSSHTSYTLDAAGEKHAFIFRMPKSGTLQKVGFRVGTITSGKGGTVDVSLETVDDTTGDPTGTLKYTNGNGSIAIADTDDNKALYAQINGGTGVTVALGDLVAFVITAPVGYGGSIPFNAILLNNQNNYYSDSYLTGAWVKSTYIPQIVLEIDGAMVNPNITNPYALGRYLTLSWDSSYRAGFKFTAPVKMRISGVAIIADLDVDADLILYDSDGVSVLETVSFDKDVRSISSAETLTCQFVSGHIIEKDESFRVVLLPTSAGSVGISYMVLTVDGSLNPGGATIGGLNFIYTTCTGEPTDEDSWTDDPLCAVIAYMIIDQIIEPDASGGIMRNPGMEGGCNA